MKELILLLTMLFCHIVDDYYLQVQGWLASAKQKGWWEENAPEKLYEYDYIWALLVHSFSWTFMVMLPILISTNNMELYLIVFILNLSLHAITDNLKANVKVINLWHDQIIHMAQILCTFLIFFL